MPAAYQRHTGSTGGADTGPGARAAPRSGGGRGHTSKLSTSSDEGAGDTLAFITSDVDDPKLASTTSLLDESHNRQQRAGWALIVRRVRPFSVRKFVGFLCLVLVFVFGVWMIHRYIVARAAQEEAAFDMYLPPVAEFSEVANPAETDPLQWLRYNTLPSPDELSEEHQQALMETRPIAAFIALVRNSEVEEMVYSMNQLEARFNNRSMHHYDWVFFNDEEFSVEFVLAVSNATSSRCFFEVIPREHWSVPTWIDTTRFDVGRQFMGSIGVGKAWLQSYHHMCRWNAGLFAKEKRLADYEFFWRVEPGVDFSCNINYDVFRFMRDNDMAYGFNMAILDDARSFPSLWDRTKAFIKKNRDLIHDDADYSWLLQDPREEDDSNNNVPTSPKFKDDTDFDNFEYNNCQFYSNFEVGSLDFFRSKEHTSYFEYLDRTGGFYYERFGDAPIHTLSVSLFLPKYRIWYFRDIGYAHGLCEQCPPHKFRLTTDSELQQITQTRALSTNVTFLEKHRRWEHLSQDFLRQRGIPGLACGCTVSAIDHNNAKLVPFESKQHKPVHPCIRLYLGGQWLEKKADWDREAEIAAGRDGSGGYLLDGLDSNPFVDKDSEEQG